MWFGLGVIDEVLLPVKLVAISSEWGNSRGVPARCRYVAARKRGATMFIGILHVIASAVWVASAFTGWNWW